MQMCLCGLRLKKHIIFHILYIVAPLCSAFLKRTNCLGDDTKSIKPILNEAFVAFSEDIITDYNYLYCLDITMSAFVIVETTKTTLHCSKLAFD